MAIRTIITEGNPTLKKKCRIVTSFDDRLATLIDDMKQTMVQANGVGLAAPQVGILRRVVVVDTHLYTEKAYHMLTDEEYAKLMSGDESEGDE